MDTQQKNKTNFEKVIEFMEACDQEVRKVPISSADIDNEQLTIELRINLIEEEFEEFILGTQSKDIVEIADALADMLYVIYGTAASLGINIDACFSEVHRSNMTKVGHDGKVLKSPKGKVLKPIDYSPPDLKSVLESQKP